MKKIIEFIKDRNLKAIEKARKDISEKLKTKKDKKEFISGLFGLVATLIIIYILFF